MYDKNHECDVLFMINGSAGLNLVNCEEIEVIRKNESIRAKYFVGSYGTFYQMKKTSY